MPNHHNEQESLTFKQANSTARNIASGSQLPRNQLLNELESRVLSSFRALESLEKDPNISADTIREYKAETARIIRSQGVVKGVSLANDQLTTTKLFIANHPAEKIAEALHNHSPNAALRPEPNYGQTRIGEFNGAMQHNENFRNWVSSQSAPYREPMRLDKIGFQHQMLEVEKTAKVPLYVHTPGIGGGGGHNAGFKEVEPDPDPLN